MEPCDVFFCNILFFVGSDYLLAFPFLSVLHPSSQCAQDQCIQSTKFVLQAATNPLLHSQPIILGGGVSLQAKTTLGGPCSTLGPSQPSLPSSIPGLNCGGELMALRDSESHCHHHLHNQHFISPEETPSPPAALPCATHLGHHVHPVQLFDPASQDSLHEDSVRGLVKLSSVWAVLNAVLLNWTTSHTVLYTRITASAGRFWYVMEAAAPNYFWSTKWGPKLVFQLYYYSTKLFFFFMEAYFHYRIKI